MRTPWLFLLVGLSACGIVKAPEAPGLSERIAERVAEGDGAVVDLATLAPFGWTRFCAFRPYTTEDVAAEALGFRWPFQWSAVEYMDDRSFLVFLRGGQVVAAFDHTLDRGDFARLGTTCVPRANARFVVSRQGKLTNGQPHYVLRSSE